MIGRHGPTGSNELKDDIVHQFAVAVGLHTQFDSSESELLQIEIKMKQYETMATMGTLKHLHIIAHALEKDAKTSWNFQDAEMAELFGEDSESKEPRSAPSAKAPKSRATAPAAKTKAGWWALPDVPEEPIETPVEERPEGGKNS